MLVAIAAAFDRSALEYGKHNLQPGVKPRVRMQQLAFVVYKACTLKDIILAQLQWPIMDCNEQGQTLIASHTGLDFCAMLILGSH